MIAFLFSSIQWLWLHWSELTVAGAIGFLLHEIPKRVAIKQIQRWFEHGRLHRIEHNLELIKAHLGVVECADTLTPTRKFFHLHVKNGSISSWVGLLTAHSARKSTNYLTRGIPMKSLLMNSTFRRFLSFVIAIIVPIINQKLNLNLSPDVIYGIFGLAALHITGEAHVDGKKAAVAAVNAANSVLQSSTVVKPGITIPAVTPPPMKYEDIYPVVDEVHKEIARIYQNITTGKYTDATEEAVQIYMSIHQFLTKYHAQSEPAQEAAKGA